MLDRERQVKRDAIRVYLSWLQVKEKGWDPVAKQEWRDRASAEFPGWPGWSNDYAKIRSVLNEACGPHHQYGWSESKQRAQELLRCWLEEHDGQETP